MAARAKLRAPHAIFTRTRARDVLSYTSHSRQPASHGTLVHQTVATISTLRVGAVLHTTLYRRTVAWGANVLNVGIVMFCVLGSTAWCLASKEHIWRRVSLGLNRTQNSASRCLFSFVNSELVFDRLRNTQLESPSSTQLMTSSGTSIVSFTSRVFS